MSETGHKGILVPPVSMSASSRLASFGARARATDFGRFLTTLGIDLVLAGLLWLWLSKFGLDRQCSGIVF